MIFYYVNQLCQIGTKFNFLLFSFFQSGQFSEDMIPTVGFNMRKVTKGNVTIKVCCHCWLFSLGSSLKFTCLLCFASSLEANIEH